jgi:predicted transposase YdaD
MSRKKRNAATAERDAANAERDAAVEKLRQDKLDTARKMKAKGFSADDIADLTGLASGEIKAL